ncbi:MAG: UDP-N-acetylmuramoyl-tripeptide--D-alanyl-D-alanine ligase [Sulfurospirillaceae bacterium]|nr:UDP-N-acetylmuramoyl-tripeptide--D-alanyl-D-alanine ligase [Sulfurospirillaceae bacterium]
MQWYSYRLQRVVWHYNRYDWHFYFFLLPLILYYISHGLVLYLLYGIYVCLLFWWAHKRDKKLVFTPRIKRFFLFLILSTIFQDMLCLLMTTCVKYGIIIPLLVAHIFSMVYEKIAYEGFKKEARKKLDVHSNIKVIAITASYGKTSIKNFLFQMLSSHYKTYMTPRSVNTLAGIVKDINESLPLDSDIYIVEAGARERGDIDEIARFVNPHIAVVGKIGEQHLEYFKTLENIRNTKMELLNSSRLEKAFVHVSACVKDNDFIHSFGDDLSHVNATFEHTTFSVTINGVEEQFLCNLLGDFNAINLCACIHVCLSLGIPLVNIKHSIANLKSVQHRLEKIEAGGKLIIDDSFNGNFDGMMSSYELASTFNGRKVIITPGIVESSDNANKLLAQKIDEVFDLVILTGTINLNILDSLIHKAEKIIVHDKTKIETILAEHTRAGDLILFSNDAPNFM